MPNPLSRQDVEDLSSRWTCIKEKTFRKDISSSLGYSTTNLDKMVGLPLDSPTQGVGLLLSDKSVRLSEASKAFDRQITRYESLQSMADEGSRTSTLSKTQIAHLRQAAVVLGVGSFDSYIRSFVIESYLTLIFVKATPPPKVVKSWEDAIKRAIDVEPDLLTRVARLAPSDAQQLLAETVFDVHQVRLMTGNFSQAVGSLLTLNVNIGTNAKNPTMDPTEQLLELAHPMFDAFANARHWAVHAGTASRGAQPYCTNQEPMRFFGRFIGALVTIIEDRASAVI